MDDNEEKGMDTTYLGIMLVVFLVIAALAIDIGYMYVGEDDLQNAAEISALAGAQAIGQRIQSDARSGSGKLDDIVNDQVQSAARTAAIDTVSGHHKAAALIEIENNNTNRLTTENDMTVGFWNISTHTYTPGGTPVNAIQVRTRRTAESESVGLGSMGSILAKISGPQKFNYTPEAIAAFPARADANFSVCVDACDPGCTYPNICTIPERKMIRDPWDASKDPPATNRYAYTSLTYQPGDTTKLSDLICMEMSPQDVCGKEIFTNRDRDDNALRDMESMMYNPNVDKSNKDYDKATGTLQGWWVIAPVTGCPPARQEKVFERHMVTRYAMIRISRICVTGPTGCSQNNTAFDAPASLCGGDNGLYIDRISCLGCGSRTMPQFPGLHPVLVK
jgi:flagellar basal body-associated protein FliL